MPIKWSAVKVNEAMDAIDAQLALAKIFIDEAHRIAEEAKSIPHLPEYIDQSRRNLSERLGGCLDSFLSYTKRIREHIPAGAIEAEQGSTRHGSTQSLI